MAGCLKGSGWLTSLEFVNNKWGPEGLVKIKSVLSKEDLEEIFGRHILDVSWVNFSSYLHFIVAADKIFGRGDMEIVREAARYAAQVNLRGVYKIFLAVCTPSFFLNRVPRIWNTYYNVGILSVAESKKDKMIYHLAGWPDIPEYHEINHLSYLAEGARLAGAKNTKTFHNFCQRRGDTFCEYGIIWD
ncbi:hypothetical protein JW933_10685 [candidate division FCPU426 bacterium]|nr:hypothetical protein [candidate division FCPU426 bacterium]